MFTNARHTLIGLMACSWSCTVSAQQVIATCGAEYAGATVSIAITIGEPVTATVGSGANRLTQGFQQPWIDISTLVEGPPQAMDIVAYPNPARTEVFLRVGPEQHDLSWVLTDALGSLVDQGLLNRDLTRVDVSSLASGTYFMRIRAATGTSSKVFQLILTE